MTPEENHLWYDFLKKLPVTVKRQKIINNYIVDFYIDSAKTVIEIDGRQHKMSENKEADEQRDLALGKAGIKVLRYTNFDIHDRFHTVCTDILKELEIQASDLK